MPALPLDSDAERAREAQAAAVVDDATLAAARLALWAVGDGADLSRLDDHELLDLLAAATAQGRVVRAAAPAKLLRLMSAAATAAAPPPPPASAPRAAPAAPAPPPDDESTFGADVDVAAQVAALQQAARDGVPFCEECARIAAQRAGAPT